MLSYEEEMGQLLCLSSFKNDIEYSKCNYTALSLDILVFRNVRSKSVSLQGNRSQQSQQAMADLRRVVSRRSELSLSIHFYVHIYVLQIN